MYVTLLNIHSWLRWVVLIAGLWSILRAWPAGSRPWTHADNRSMRLFVGTLDAQMVLGLLLYFWLSPVTQSAMSNIGEAMKQSSARFFLVEHALGMLIAVTLAHVGAAKIRRANDARRHRLVLIFFGLALAAILLSIPWPGLPAGRPLFRI